MSKYNQFRYKGKLVSESQYKRLQRVSELGRKRRKLQSPSEVEKSEKTLEPSEQHDFNLSSANATNITNDTKPVLMEGYKDFNDKYIKVENVSIENVVNVKIENVDIANTENVNDDQTENVNIKIENADNGENENLDVTTENVYSVKTENVYNVKTENVYSVKTENVYNVKSENVDNVTTVDKVMDGRRIIEVSVLGKQLWCVVCKEALSLEYIENERRRGLGSILSIRCHKCQILNTVTTGKQHTSPDGSINRFDINSNLMLGILQAGIGWTHLNKILGCLDIPTISFSTYKRYQGEVGHSIEKCAEEGCVNAPGVD